MGGGGGGGANAIVVKEREPGTSYYNHIILRHILRSKMAALGADSNQNQIAFR